MNDVSKLNKLFGLVGVISGGAAAFSQFRKARKDSDRLALAHALTNLAVTVTGAALFARSLRKDDQE
ncbi:hypothetical protein FHR81_004256 [Actinoalloteichus hoggarensis]|uniref:Uncharacterized protein n=2 Tax=Actinoalloteichus TaxID=65496 RepID=A0A221W8Y9_9PSEU|nr:MULTISPECIES: hypothetical protein [Actinoalloteichus]APU17210.1 hypothetical protein UA74_26025 [Actinoalloteichus fjordicus]APU23293.1 hypothetical protein UA75_26610 [Actinoalloteichus sp. GBA129-24]ASO22388.1 hypothetical protein AHOG_23910 [Actinoalloteichus hoggarensis]MBB5923189.1 hypothetical protein [Actinoalloteichus hoggarensis]